MEMGDLKKVSDLELPEGLVVEYDTNQTLVSVSSPSVSATESAEEEGDETEEAAPTAQGEQ